jgi:hypothetical protein
LPVQGQIFAPQLSGMLTPLVAPKETVSNGRVDVLFILDGSGSVGEDNFNRMKEFCAKVIV